MAVEVLDFHAEWCGPCTQQEPVLDDLDADYDDVTFTSIDIEENVDTAKAYNVNTVPTLVILDDDEIHTTLTGYQPREAIEEHLSALE